MRQIPIDREFGAPAATPVRTPAICRWLRAVFFGVVTMAAVITVEVLATNQGPGLGEFLATFFIIVGFLIAD
jgi:hypothetical protein